MTKQGWIALHRKIQEHHLWEDKPFSKGQAWIDLLLLANHEDKKFLLGNEVIIVEQGMVVTSIEKLKVRWGWSNTKVVNFLKLLENDEMITRKSDTKKTVLTLLNYSNYSGYEKTKTMPKRYEKDTKTIRKHTNNNDNNVNNENNDNKLSYSDDPKLNDALIKFIEHRKKLKKPMTDYAVKLLIGKLNKMTPSIEMQIDILNQSIESGWLGVFELKKEKAKSSYAAYDLDAFEKMLDGKDSPKKNGYDDFMNELASLRE